MLCLFVCLVCLKGMIICCLNVCYFIFNVFIISVLTDVQRNKLLKSGFIQFFLQYHAVETHCTHNSNSVIINSI